MADTKSPSVLSVITADEQFRGGMSPSDLPTEDFKAEVASFVTSVAKSFESIKVPADNVTLTEFSVTATVGAKGKLSLLGSGVEASGTAGITFKFAVS